VLLSTGKLIKEFKEGKGQNRHMFISTDFRAIVTNNPVQKAVVSDLSLGTWSIS
jgi:hypothetical protein